jgi:hypothetical protein
MAIHPSEKDTSHELYLLCDCIESFVDEMKLVNAQLFRMNLRVGL